MKLTFWVQPAAWPGWVWALLVLLLLALSLPGLGRAWRGGLAYRQWRRWRPYASLPALRAAWRGFLAPAAAVPGTGRVDLFTWLDTEIHDPQPVRTRFLLLGPPEAGRTTALLRWAARAHPGFRVLYRPLAHPQALTGLDTWPDPERTILLLDSLDEDPGLRHGLAERLDHILEVTSAFGRLLLTATPALLPPEAAGGRHAASYHYVGKRQYQVFLMAQLVPWPPRLLARRWRRHLSRRQEGEAVAHLDRLPALLGLPGWADTIPLVVAGQRQARGISELIATEIHAWVGTQRKPEAMFAFLLDLAGALYTHWEATGSSYLPRTEWVARRPLRRRRPGPPALAGRVADLGYGFYQRRHWAWLLGWRAFFQAGATLPPDLTWPQATQAYREFCWAQWLEAAPEALSVRLADAPDKLPAAEVPWQALATITRIYCTGPLPRDLRLLTALPALRGVYFQPTAPLTQLPPDLVAALPRADTMVYVPQRGGGWRAWHGYRHAQQRHLPGGQVRTFEAYHPLRGLALWEGSLANPAQGHHRILRLLPAGWEQWPRPGDQEELVTGTGAPLEVRIYSRILAPAFLDLFDRLRAYRRPDGVQHLLFENRHRPTFFVPYLAEVTNRLFALLGEDDHYQAEFTPDDAAQIEDGHWTGRRWTRQNTDAYAYPVLLYLESPWQVRLWVLG